MLRCKQRWLGLSFALTVSVLGQTPQAPPQQINPQRSLEALRPEYALGPNDQILVSAPGAEEIDQRPFRIDSEGNIEFPLVGKIHASGLTVGGLENVLRTRLRDYIREPRVTITITQFRSEPVYFLGAFHAPGIYPLTGGLTLVEMLAITGGLLPTASRRITITRKAEYGTIDLPNAVKDAARKVSTVEISVDSLSRNINPAEDIALMAYDVVFAETAQPIYVSGEVTRSLAIPLNDEPSISVTQALAQAGGLTKDAVRGRVRILRPIVGTTRRAEIDVNMNRIYEGKDNDFPLLPNDVVYVPRATARAVLAPIGQGLLTSMPYLLISLAIGGVL